MRRGQVGQGTIRLAFTNTWDRGTGQKEYNDWELAPQMNQRDEPGYCCKYPCKYRGAWLDGFWQAPNKGLVVHQRAWIAFRMRWISACTNRACQITISSAGNNRRSIWRRDRSSNRTMMAPAASRPINGDAASSARHESIAEVVNCPIWQVFGPDNMKNFLCVQL